MNLSVQEIELILAGLRKLPMEVVAEIHAKLHKDATEQFQAAQAPAEKNEEIGVA